MTEQQKSEAEKWLAWRHTVYLDTNQRFIEDGNLVRFTNVRYQGRDNWEFEINDCPDWSIWFSQLNMWHINKEINGFVVPVIRFKSGQVETISDMIVEQFYEKVKGRTFKVILCPSFATFNIKSKIWDNLPDDTYQEGLKYVVNCIEKNEINELKDFIKPVPLYLFDEI